MEDNEPLAIDEIMVFAVETPAEEKRGLEESVLLIPCERIDLPYNDIRDILFIRNIYVYVSFQQIKRTTLYIVLCVVW